MRFMIIVKATRETETEVAGTIPQLIAGYTLIQVRSREEALQWSRRFPNPVGAGMEADIEVRQLYELEDFGETENTQRFRDLGMS